MRPGLEARPSPEVEGCGDPYVVLPAWAGFHGPAHGRGAEGRSLALWELVGDGGETGPTGPCPALLPSQGPSEAAVRPRGSAPFTRQTQAPSQHMGP